MRKKKAAPVKAGGFREGRLVLQWSAERFDGDGVEDGLAVAELHQLDVLGLPSLLRGHRTLVVTDEPEFLPVRHQET